MDIRTQLKQAIRAAFVTVAVLSILCFLWYACGGYTYYMAGVDKLKLEETRSAMRNMQMALEQYRTQVGGGSYPTTLLEVMERVACEPVLDPWGNNYQYQTNGSAYTVSTIYYKHRFGTTETVRMVSGDTGIVVEEH